MSGAVSVTLPDGKQLSLPDGATVLDVAREIGPGLAKAALAGRIGGRLVDLRAPLEDDVALEIVTAKDAAGGEVIRHSAEHVMADAVKRLFPEAQVDAGRTDHSEKFQYDFLVDEPFTPDDIERIEKEMNAILAEGADFEREVLSRDAAFELFRSMGEELKLTRLGDIPDGEDITVFRHGRFVDLCRGPHVQTTSQIGAVKLLESSGTYFRGDESGPKLQRIYGTAFESKKALKSHLARIEEAKKRDHRRVGADLGLFHLDPLAPGSPFYLPKGMALYNELVRFIQDLYPKLRLPRGHDAAALPVGALQDVRPLREVPRRHVLVRRLGRGRRAGREGDELPRPLPSLRDGQAQLPRAPDPLGRVQPAPPQRALGHAERHHPRAHLRPRTTRTSTASRRRCPTRSTASSG